MRTKFWHGNVNFERSSEILIFLLLISSITFMVIVIRFSEAYDDMRNYALSKKLHRAIMTVTNCSISRDSHPLTFRFYSLRPFIRKLQISLYNAFIYLSYILMHLFHLSNLNAIHRFLISILHLFINLFMHFKRLNLQNIKNWIQSIIVKKCVLKMHNLHKLM